MHSHIQILTFIIPPLNKSAFLNQKDYTDINA